MPGIVVGPKESFEEAYRRFRDSAIGKTLNSVYLERP